MPAMATKSSGVCERARSAVGGLCCESAIITLTLVSVLAVAGEMLIDYGILKAPPNREAAAGWSPSNLTSGAGDLARPSPGDQQSSTASSGLAAAAEADRQTMEIVRKVFHYLSLAIAAVFFLEIVIKLVVYRTLIFRRHWQIIDILVVMVTLAVEIAFEVTPRIPELEPCTFVVVFRLIRLPYTCSIKARKVRQELEQDIDLWKAGKCKLEDKCSNLEARNNKQKERLERLQRELDLLRKSIKESQQSSQFITEQGVIPTGTLSPNYVLAGSNQSLNSAHQGSTAGQTQDGELSPHPYASPSSEEGLDFPDGHHEGRPRAVSGPLPQQGSTDKRTDRGSDEPLHGRLYTRSGSESSLSCQGVHEHEVHVQIEDREQDEGTSSNKMESTPSTPVRLIKDNIDGSNSALCYDNEGYDPNSDDYQHYGEELLCEIDGTRTYRSADGIPMTDL